MGGSTNHQSLPDLYEWEVANLVWAVPPVVLYPVYSTAVVGGGAGSSAGLVLTSKLCKRAEVGWAAQLWGMGV